MTNIKSKFSEKELVEIQEQINTESGFYDYMSKDYPFEVIASKFGDEENMETTLYVPSYQRNFVWDPKKQSRFIESVLLGVPLTPFLVSEDENGRLEIIDGSQRIRTLIAFYEGKLRLRGLDKLAKINNAKFKDLPKKSQNYFKNRDFKIIVTDAAETTVKQDIFNRINTGSESLTDSEIRKGAYAGNFYDLVLELKKDTSFQKVCPVSEQKKDRGEYEELILRFFAYMDRYLEFKHDVANFLNDYLDDMNQSLFDKAYYIKSFKEMVDFVENNFSIGLRKDEKNNSIPRVRFEAIAVGIHLALKESPNLTAPNMDWLESKGFKIQTTSDSSNNQGRLQSRVEFVRDGLLGKLTLERLSNG